MQTLNFPQFVALEDKPQLTETLAILDNSGCVLNYIAVRCDNAPDASSHGDAALAAMERIVQFYEYRAQTLSGPQYPIEQFWRVTLDAKKLKGAPISTAKFWGNDDAFPKASGENCFLIPPIDGYKTAFFNPPLGIGLPISALIPLFDSVNAHLWNDDLGDCSIYNWSTEWSNYFDAGHEYWGAFWWTVYSPQTRLLTAIGASASD